jgi:formiminoglutamase
MSLLKTYTKQYIESFVSKRAGEVKFGEKTQVFSSWEALQNSTVKYVLLGIPEDIGVRANYGKEGTSSAWHSCLKILCNIQENHLTQPENVVILGEIDCKTQMNQAATITNKDSHYAEKLGELVTQIDDKVSQVVQQIVSAGKIPILIGGGHNNSFGNIKGTSYALKTPIHCINFDAHTDFRALEHRHSGNGFSYAFEEGFLDKYFIFGLHRNYTSQSVFNEIDKNKARIQFNLFEDIKVKNKISFLKAMQQAGNFCFGKQFGLELDMDAIEGMGSSAISPSGFSVNEARQFIHYFSTNENCAYIHICEGSTSAEVFSPQVAKTIAYLITDVIAT